MQLRPGLDLEGRLLAVVEEGGWEPEAPPVLVHDLGGGARAGEEAGVEMGQLGHERPARRSHPRPRPRRRPAPRRARRPRPARVGRGRWAASPTGRRPTGAGRPSPPSARQMPREVMATTRARMASKRQGDDEGHDEARGPGGVVGALERGLLPVRAEHPAQTVDHELDAQQERDHGQRERRGPEVAAQPPVQHARGDEATRRPRIVQALHAGEPGPVVGGCRVHGGVAVGSERPGAHEHGARPGARLAREVDPVAHRHTAPLQRLHQRGIPLGRAPSRRSPGSRRGRRRHRARP